jgi:hypothetical protein
MNWIHRLSLIALAAGTLGLLNLVHASAMAGWASITVFGRGLVLGAGGALAMLLLALGLLGLVAILRRAA